MALLSVLSAPPRLPAGLSALPRAPPLLCSSCAGVAAAEVAGVVETAPHVPSCLLQRATGHPEKGFQRVKKERLPVTTGELVLGAELGRHLF